MTTFDTGIATRKTAQEMVAAYHQAISDIEAGYKQVFAAEEILKSAFGEHYSDFSTLPDHCRDNNAGVLKSVEARLRRNAWKAIVNKLDIRKIMSVKRVEEMDKRLEEADLPPIDEAAVFDMLKSLSDSAETFVADAVKEVFDYLRPAAHQAGWQKTYKTNELNGKFELGKKVILGWMVERGYSRTATMRVRYGQEKYLIAIDHVFALLDGKATGDKLSYQSPLVDAINTSPDGKGETEYFKFEAYLNMNLHLEFKRMDLVKLINQIATDGTQLRSAR